MKASDAFSAISVLYLLGPFPREKLEVYKLSSSLLFFSFFASGLYVCFRFEGDFRFLSTSVRCVFVLRFLFRRCGGVAQSFSLGETKLVSKQSYF